MKVGQSIHLSIFLWSEGELPDGSESGISVVTLALAFQILSATLVYLMTMPQRFQQARMVSLEMRSHLC